MNAKIDTDTAASIAQATEEGRNVPAEQGPDDTILHSMDFGETRLHGDTFYLGKAALDLILKHASTDASRVTLTSVYFDKTGEIVATDGHRLAMCEPMSMANGLTKSALISAVELKALLPVLQKTSTLTITIAEDGRVTARVFHDVKNEARAAPTIELKNSADDVSFPPYRQIIATGEGKEEGTTGFNGRYLAEAAHGLAKLTHKCLGAVVFKYHGDLDPLHVSLRDPTLGEWTIVLMPMRL